LKSPVSLAIFPAVPTPKSAEAFARLAAARSRLSDVTKRLNECHEMFLAEGQAARERYAHLQMEWDEAFSAFEKATEEFSAIVKKLNQDVEAHRLPKTD
jgi:hypothetical protein